MSSSAPSPRSPEDVPEDRRELVLAQNLDDAAGDVPLRPVEGPSREELLLEREPLPLPAPAATAAPRFQFTVFDLMIVMVGIAGGLAGGTWMPSDIFAGVLGLVTLLGLLLVHFFPPESHTAKLIWSTLVLAYVVAVFAAVMKPVR